MKFLQGGQWWSRPVFNYQNSCLVPRLRRIINGAIVKWLLLACTQTLFHFSFRKHRRAREKGVYFLSRALDGLSGGSRGGARGGLPPLLLRPNWGPTGRKNFFWNPSPPYLRVWMAAPPPPPPPPPPYLKVRIRHWDFKEKRGSVNRVDCYMLWVFF